MRYFQKLAENIDTSMVIQQLVRHPELWDADRFRTSYPGTPHSDVSDILLRFSDTATSGLDSQVIGDGNTLWQPASKILTAVKPLVLGVMRMVDGWVLDRVIISRLRPGGKIAPHADDQGDYVNNGSRYHIILQNQPGSVYYCGNEAVTMMTGDVYWFQHLEVHSVENNSRDDRISLMVDTRIWE